MPASQALPRLVTKPARVRYCSRRRLIEVRAEDGVFLYHPLDFQQVMDESEDAMALYRAEQRGVVVSPQQWMRQANH